MRALLEVMHGPSAGKTAELADGQTLVVGRLDECDLVISRDPYVSRQHCEFRLESSKCVVKNLSNNGTRVNGTTVERPIALEERDTVEIGRQTVLRVKFLPDRDLQATAVPLLSETQTAVSTPAKRRSGASEREMVVSTLPKDAVSGAWLNSEAVQAWPAYLIVDFSKLELQRAQFAGGEPLLNWLPEKTRDQHSPIILSADELQDVSALFESSRGKDAMIAVLSSEEPPDLFQKLRDVAGVFSAPSVVLAHLAVSEPKYLKHMFPWLEAIVVENPAEECWTLFCTTAFQQAVGAK